MLYWYDKIIDLKHLYLAQMQDFSLSFTLIDVITFKGLWSTWEYNFLKYLLSRPASIVVFLHLSRQCGSDDFLLILLIIIVIIVLLLLIVILLKREHKTRNLKIINCMKK